MEIIMAQGTYTGTGSEVMAVTQSIMIYGGWDGAAGSTVVRDPDIYISIIDGEDQRRGVVVGSGLTVTLEGFTIAYGADPYRGGGLLALDANLTLRDMTFDDNAVDSSGALDYAYGGGAFVEGGVLQVETTIFYDNYVSSKSQPCGGGIAISHTLATTVTQSLFDDNFGWNGGGLCFLGDSAGSNRLLVRDSTFVDNGSGYAGALRLYYANLAQIEDNTFRGNWSSGDRGAIAIWSSDAVLARNVITGGWSGRTAAIEFSATTFTMTNNIVAGNEGRYDWEFPPTIRVRNGSNGRLVHNTVADNVGHSGILIDSGSSVWLTNTILVSHTVGISVTAGSTATLEGTLWGSGDWANTTDWGGSGTVTTGTVNIWGYPVFASPATGDYHIVGASAAAGRGVDAGLMTDIDGDPRPTPAGTPPDLGADEVLQYRVYLPLVVRTY
jgi:hypothetical protein